MPKSGHYQSSRSYRKNVHLPADPYMNEEINGGKVICSECRSFYLNKRWYKDDDALDSLIKKKEFVYSKCPACRKKRDNFPQGIVSLKGFFFGEHKDEIMRLVANEGKKAMGFNPLERIIEITIDSSSAVITTTTEKLAQRIGRSVKKACSGKVRYSWSAGNKMARVCWER